MKPAGLPERLRRVECIAAGGVSVAAEIHGFVYGVASYRKPSGRAAADAKQTNSKIVRRGGKTLLNVRGP